MTYKLLRNQAEILNKLTGAVFPPTAGNRHYQEYLAWLALGNTPEEADPEPPPGELEVARDNTRQWYNDNPNAKLLFTLDATELDAEIDDLINDLFPSATNANRTRLKLLLKALARNDRVYARREGLINGQ